jgi:hypothetical protein
MVEHTEEDIPRYIVPESVSGERIIRALLEVRINGRIRLALYDDGSSLVTEDYEEICSRLLEALMLVTPKNVESLAFIIPTKVPKKEEASTGGTGSDDNSSS